MIICVAWKTDVMPVSSYCYYHEGCYNPQTDARANRRIRTVASSDVSLHAQCSACGGALRKEVLA